VFFSYEWGNGIARVEPSNGNKLTEWQVPTKRSRPYGIQVASDGTVWASEFLGNELLQLDPRTGDMCESAHPVRANESGLRRRAIDSKGNIRVAEHEWGGAGTL
jgi:virginiamycin B lyase